jgi:hypothetical protein
MEGRAPMSCSRIGFRPKCFEWFLSNLTNLIGDLFHCSHICKMLITLCSWNYFYLPLLGYGRHVVLGGSTATQSASRRHLLFIYHSYPVGLRNNVCEELLILGRHISGSQLTTSIDFHSLCGIIQRQESRSRNKTSSILPSGIFSLCTELL